MLPASICVFCLCSLSFSVSVLSIFICICALCLICISASCLYLCLCSLPLSVSVFPVCLPVCVCAACFYLCLQSSHFSPCSPFCSDFLAMCLFLLGVPLLASSLLFLLLSPQVTSERMQGVLLLVFAQCCHLPFLRGVQTQTTRTGLGGYWVRNACPTQRHRGTSS